ncbi:hypothetical protein CN491_02620 [Bacillus cereus]|uniref:DUF1883 domain-containing protein n=2 Tax=Bacillus TaxID=1386 RepID=A0A2B2GB72_BACCE|nr:hypothetical protein CN491_02620 [Bacillus cereus]PFP81106.1 hypothetical protein COJ95_07055 [Bacillus cereus]
MKYSYSQEQLNAGDIVSVTLDSEANVLLLDSSNYSRFKRGQRYNYFGGLAKSSPARIKVPRSGLWYIVINLGGYAGKVNYSVNIIRN